MCFLSAVSLGLCCSGCDVCAFVFLFFSYVFFNLCGRLGVYGVLLVFCVRVIVVVFFLCGCGRWGWVSGRVPGLWACVCAGALVSRVRRCAGGKGTPFV